MLYHSICLAINLSFWKEAFSCLWIIRITSGYKELYSNVRVQSWRSYHLHKSSSCFRYSKCAALRWTAEMKNICTFTPWTLKKKLPGPTIGWTNVIWIKSMSIWTSVFSKDPLAKHLHKFVFHLHRLAQYFIIRPAFSCLWRLRESCRLLSGLSQRREHTRREYSLQIKLSLEFIKLYDGEARVILLELMKQQTEKKKSTFVPETTSRPMHS